MTAANVWRGEWAIESAGGKAVVAITHDGIARMRDALEVNTANDLLEALARLDHDVLAKALAVCESVSGDPVAVLLAARGIEGLDAIADALVGMVLGRTPEEHDAEKKREAAREEARTLMAVRLAMSSTAPKKPKPSPSRKSSKRA